MVLTTSRKILLVDDDPHLRATVGDFLRYEGFQVLRAADGHEALRILKDVIPDLVLLDVMMPGMDGGDVAQQIRNDPRISHVPVIFTTAVVSKQEELSHDGCIGGESFLAKPFGLDELMARIESALAPEGGN